MKYTLSIGDTSSEELRQALLDPLVAHNNQMAGLSNYRVLTVSIENKDKETVGGLYGRTAYGWLFIELIIVPEPLRGQGIGRKLVEMAEEEALNRGCHSVWLDTFEFQAKTFYEKLGYVVFGELPNYPDDFARYFMKKTLIS